MNHDDYHQLRNREHTSSTLFHSAARLATPRLALLLLFLSYFTSLALVHAQQDNTTASVTNLTAPSSTTSVKLTAGTIATFHIPPPPTQDSNTEPEPEPLQIFLSVCSPPTSWSFIPSSIFSSGAIPFIWASNDSTITTSPGPNDGIDPVGLANYLSVNLYRGGISNFSLTPSLEGGGIWFTLFAPTNDTLQSENDIELDTLNQGKNLTDPTLQWTFSIQLSPVSTPAFTLDRSAGYRVHDADSTSVLMTTPSYDLITSSDDSTTPLSSPNYTSYMAPTSNQSLSFSSSICFLSQTLSGVGAIPPRNYNVSTVPALTDAGEGFTTRYIVQGLIPNTNYTTWLVQTGDQGNARLWQPNYFQTQSSKSCKLIYDAPLCPMVSYSVPTPLGASIESLIAFYSTNLTTSLQAFNRTLSTFPCDYSTGRYSPISTCSDCYSAYLTWLCAVTFPRCTDAAQGVGPINASATVLLPKQAWSDSWFLPALEDPSNPYPTAILRNNPIASRTPLLTPDQIPLYFPNASTSSLMTSPFPYAEIVPCLNAVCELVGARCPPLIGWDCPRSSRGMGRAGYGLLAELPPPPPPSVRATTKSKTRSSGSGRVAEPDSRQWGFVENVDPDYWTSWDSDRFGNWFCNSLGNDQLLAQQFVKVASDGF